MIAGKGAATACRRAAARQKDPAARSKASGETAVHDHTFDPSHPSSNGTPASRHEAGHAK